MSIPFNGKMFRLRQPDGTTLDVRGFGNNRHAVFETLDGYTVERDPHSGFYAYARLSSDGAELLSTGIRPESAPAAALNLPLRLRAPSVIAGGVRRLSPIALAPSRWEQRREAARRALQNAFNEVHPAPPQRRTTGDFVGLCLPVQFSDEPGTISKAQIEAFCNQVGYTDFGNNGSVFDYYLRNSLGKLKYTNLVAEYYTAKKPKAYYTDPQIAYPNRAQELIREALTFHKAKGFDFSSLTTDNQGFVYALNVFYAGTCPNEWSEGLWPHQSTLDPAFTLGTGRKVGDYQVTDIGAQLTLGTFCHENGHMLCDFPDLYDYREDGVDSSGIGAYCLMCAGANVSETNPVEVGAYLKYKAGWAGSVTLLEDGLHASAPAGANEFFLRARNQVEYFIIENRQKTGRDKALPSEGLAIWHVDELGDNERQNMTSQLHYECSLEQADNKFDLEKGRGLGDPSDFFSAQTGAAFGNATQPDSRWWDGTPSGLEITAISASGPTMTFVVGAGAPATTPLDRTSSPAVAIPDNNPGGVTDSISFVGTNGARVASVKVAVDITHTFRGDLKVELLAPSGAAVLLHDRAGGAEDDLKVTYSAANSPGLNALNGTTIEGAWKLRVQDLASKDTGTLNRWDLSLTAGDAAPDDALFDKSVSPGEKIPDNAPGGVSSRLSVASARKVKEVRVEVDITHSYIGDLIVALQSPVGSRVVLHDRTGGDADNLIKTFDSGAVPDLVKLAGESAAGDWTLQVSDHEAQDTGKLNRWRLVVIFQ